MSDINIRVNEILTNALFRNVVHLIATVSFSYLLLRLLLYILDAAHLGIGWLETHSESGLMVIFLIFVISLLIMDAVVSRVRRYFGDEKCSIAQTGISYIKARIQGTEDRIHQFIKQETSVTKQNIGVLSEMISTLEPEKPVEPEVSAQVPLEPAPEPSGLEGLIKGKEAEVKHEVKPEKPLTPQPIKEPESNILYTDTVPILVKEGKRVIKAFEAEHSINVIDFKSKVTKKDVKITVELLKGPSKLAAPIEDQLIYEFDNIWVDLSNDYIENAVVRFNVKREWISKHKVRDIKLQQFINGNWAIMPTKRIGQDAKHLFYEAYVPSFSVPFAIVGT